MSSSPFRSSDALRIRLPWRGFAAVFFAFVISGCAVMFVAPYDEQVDKQLTELHQKTRVFLAKMNSTRGTYADNKGFYQEAHADVAVLMSRAKLYGAEKNKGTLDNLQRLDAAFNDLEEGHQAGPLRGSAWANTMDIHFEALLQIELHKKFSSGVAAPKT
jgi:hypothetical protein